MMKLQARLFSSMTPKREPQSIGTSILIQPSGLDSKEESTTLQTSFPAITPRLCISFVNSSTSSSPLPLSSNLKQFWCFTVFYWLLIFITGHNYKRSCMNYNFTIFIGLVYLLVKKDV